MAEISKKKLSGESLWSIGASLLVAVFGIGYIVIIGNQWGSNGLGIFSLSLSIYFFGSILGNLGLHQAIIFEIAQETEQAGQTITTGLLGSLGMGIMTGTLGYLAADLIAGVFQQPSMKPMIQLFCLAMPLFLLNKTLQGVYNAYRDLKLLSLSQILRGASILIALLVLLWQDQSLELIPYAFIAAESLLLLIFGMILLLKYPLGLPQWQIFKKLLAFGWKSSLSGVLSDANSRLDIIVIGLFWSASTVGVYTLATHLAKGLWLLPGAVQRVTNPLLVQLYAKKDWVRLEQTIQRLLKLGIPFFILLSGGLALTAEWLITILYPAQPEMLGALLPLYLLLPGSILFASISLIGSAPSSSIGKPENALYIMLGTLISNLVLNLALVPIYGNAGAAIATGISLLIATGIFAFFTQKYLNLHLPYLAMGLQFSLLLGLGLALHQWGGGVSALLLLPGGMIGLLILMTLLGLLGKGEWKQARDLVISQNKGSA